MAAEAARNARDNGVSTLSADALKLHEGKHAVVHRPKAADGKKQYMKAMCTCESCQNTGQRHFLGCCPAQQAQRAQRAANYKEMMERKSDASSTTADTKRITTKKDSRPVELFFTDFELLELKKHTKVLREIEKLEKLPKLDKLQLEKVERKKAILNTSVMRKKAAGYTAR